jgi:hypothetical protein
MLKIPEVAIADERFSTRSWIVGNLEIAPYRASLVLAPAAPGVRYYPVFYLEQLMVS